MTTRKAVSTVLKEWEPGNVYYGYQIHEQVIKKLRQNGVTKRPLDSSVLRRVREQAPLYGISTISKSKSLYFKRPSQKDESHE